MKKITLLLIALCLIINIFAYSLYEYNYGNYVNSNDARSRSMGGSGVASGVSLFDSNINPANLSFLKNDVNAGFSYSLMKNDEDRSLPMFNFFDSYIDNSTYSNMSNNFPEMGFGISYKSDLGSNDKMSVSAAAMFRPYINFDSNYEEQVRNDHSSDNNMYPHIIAKNYKESSGAINAYSLLLAYSLNLNDINKLSLGLDVSMLNGSLNQETRIIWDDYAYTVPNVGVFSDYHYKASSDYDGMMFKLGTNCVVNERTNLGFTYQMKSELDTESKVNSVQVNNPADYIIPSAMKIGVSFKPRNPYKTVFQFDIEKINYSEVNKFFDDSFAIYLGVEHYVGNAVPLRLGFRHESSMLDKTVTIPTISAGTQFNLTEKISLALSGEFSTRTYDTLDLFPDSFYNVANLWNSITPTDRGWENPDRVEERFFKLQTSLNYNW